MILNTSTDDFLCAYSNQTIFDTLCTHLKRFFGITTEEGTLLKCLNLRIIQSPFGISVDQSEHIERTIINNYFPPEKVAESGIKAAHTPFNTCNKYEIDLLKQLPAIGEYLKALKKRNGGTYLCINHRRHHARLCMD